MNCIVVDDEHLALKIIEDWVSNIPFLDLVGSFRSTLKALEFLQKNKIDLLFLDINVPALSGTQLARLLTDDQMVIFTTAYPQFAVESYEINAVDYLMKPIEFDRFLKAAMRAKDIFDLKSQKKKSLETIDGDKKSMHNKEYLFVKSGKKIFKIEIKAIKYIEAAGSYVNYVTDEKKYMCLQNMDETLSLLPDDFVRVHKSYIISLKQIEKIEDNHIKVCDQNISIGKTFRDNFYEKLRP